MSRPSSKPYDVRIREAEQKALRLRMSAAKDAAKSDPMLAKIHALLESFNKDTRRINLILTGNNSADKRLESARLRMAWIQAEKDFTIAEEKNVDRAKKYLTEQINDLSVRIQHGEKIGEAEIMEISRSIPSEDISALFTACQDAETRWRSYAPTGQAKASNASEQLAKPILAEESGGNELSATA